jgi:hypothetical protein
VTHTPSTASSLLSSPALTGRLKERHETVVVAVSPPRASSTAFARALWANPAIAHYAHEPYEAAYFANPDGVSPGETLSSPLALEPHTGPKTANGLLVKEITFQAERHFGDLAGLATGPVVFLVRDPRLTIASRRNICRAQGESLDFPLAQTGWTALAEQVAYCAAHGIDYCVVDAHDLRTAPLTVLAAVCDLLGLRFDATQLSWSPRPGLRLSNHRTGGGVDHFFTRVLASRGIEPPTETVPALTDFPAGELRDHVAWALDVHRELLRDPRRVCPSAREGEPDADCH